MYFDLRIAIGALFAVYGVVLTVYGAFGGPAQYSRSLGLNVNLIWGALMLLFGLGMLISRGRKR
jgi:hypothetical protein